jgi:L-histidine Nalpha-methyltransferase
MALEAPITLALHHVGVDRHRVLVEDVRQGLTDSPKHLPSRYLYDDRGCELFEAITDLPEYYVTRAEEALLRRHAEEIIRVTEPVSLVEIGAGSCRKTSLLIDPARRLGWGQSFVPFDISEEAVRTASEDLVNRFPGLHVYGMVGDFEEHLAAIPRLGRQLVLFLGSTIGNLEPDERVAFLRQVRTLLEPDDAFLLGIDLVKSVDVLNAAYNDAQGVTAAFNRNVLSFLNRELGANFDLDQFDHVAYYDEDLQRVELHLKSRRHQLVEIPDASLSVVFEAGECLHTEISTKFTETTVRESLEAAGLVLRHWYTDEEGRFGAALAGAG